MPPSPTVFGTRLLVRDFAACYEFYHRKLGLGSRFGDGEPPYAELTGGGSLIALFERSAMESAVAGLREPSGNPMVLVLAVDDVDREFDRLSALGLAFASPPTDRPAWSLRTAHLRDPEGNLVELCQDLPRAKDPTPSG